MREPRGAGHDQYIYPFQRCAERLPSSGRREGPKSFPLRPLPKSTCLT